MEETIIVEDEVEEDEVVVVGGNNTISNNNNNSLIPEEEEGMEEIDTHNNNNNSIEISTNNNNVDHQIRMDSLGQLIQAEVEVGKDREKIMVIRDKMQDVASGNVILGSKSCCFLTDSLYIIVIQFTLLFRFKSCKYCQNT